MKDEVNVALQLKSNKLREEAQAENQDFLNSLDSDMKRIIKEQVKAQTSKIMTKVKKYVTKTLGAEVLVRSTNQPQTSYAKNLYRVLLEAYYSNKDLLSSYGEVVTLKRGRDDQDKDEEPSVGSNRGSKQRRSGKEESSRETTQKASKSTSSSKGSRTPDREWNQTKTVNDRPPQQSMTKLAQASVTTSSFNEFLATLIDFSAFMMNQLNIQNLTQDLLTGPTYDLIKGTCKSVVDKPPPLIPDARGRQIIPYDHFINNDLEYLKGGSSSRKYTTSIPKTKAPNYGHVKWIKYNIPKSTWSEVQVVYDKHAYWGTYHWGPKHQRFYGYATNMETLKDVYSKHRIIVVISLKIMEFFGYTHLDEITVRSRQGKMMNLNVDEVKAIRRRCKNLTKPEHHTILDITLKDSITMYCSCNFHKVLSIRDDIGYNSFATVSTDGDFTSSATAHHSNMFSPVSNDIATGFTPMEYLIRTRYRGENGSNLDLTCMKDVMSNRIGVTHWFTLIVLSALRRSDNENMLSRSLRIRRIRKDGGEGT
ncbi:hypothetical protein Tco_0317826 [Tanacetum coccineum]